MEQLDKILSVVVDTQADVRSLNGRVGHLEEVQDKTYNKLVSEFQN